MTTASPAVFRQALQVCGNLVGEAVYDCLKSYLGEDGGSTRTLQEVLIRSLGIYVIAMGTYGHLMSMQGFASANPRKALLLLIAFFLVPSLAATQLLSRTVAFLLRLAFGKFKQYRYWLSVYLGTHIIVCGKPVPLSDINPTCLRSKRNPYGIVWLARLILLLLLLVQYTSTIGIWLRSRMMYNDRVQIYAILDYFGLFMSIGGIAAATNSMFLSLLNTTWEHIPPSVIGLQTIHISGNDIDTFETSEREILSQIEQREFANIHTIDEAFRNRLDLLFPQYFQQALEDGMIFQAVWGAMASTLTITFSHLSDLSILVKQKSQVALSNYFRDTTSNLEYFECSFRALLDYYKYDLVCALITIVPVIRLFAHSEKIRKHARIMSIPFVFCDKWITGGRSIFSFPCFFALLVFHIWRWSYYIYAFLDMYRDIHEDLKNDNHWERLHWGAYMYKDPWYDSMYIL